MGKGGGSGWGVGRGSGEGAGAYRGKSDRIAVPAMPMPMAIFCCVLNFLIPGLGTMVAGLSMFCCARNEDMDLIDKCFGCFASAGIGCLQLFTAVACLFGWVWSCVWGYYFIFSSSEYYNNNKPEDQDGQPEAVIVNQNGQTGIVVTQPPRALTTLQYKNNQTGTQVVVIQPEPLAPPAYNSLPNPLPPPYPGTTAEIGYPVTTTGKFDNAIYPSPP